MTNICLLFQKYTDLASHLKGLSIMGGAVGGGFTYAPMGKVKGEGERFGNWTSYAEFNVRQFDCTLDDLGILTNLSQIYVCIST